jgi:hypothetical protein
VALKPLRGEREQAAGQVMLPLADPGAIAARLRAH